MRLEEIKKIAMEKGVRPGRMKKTTLIRAIQQAEHFACCFETGRAKVCGQEHSLWRPNCV